MMDEEIEIYYEEMSSVLHENPTLYTTICGDFKTLDGHA